MTGHTLGEIIREALDVAPLQILSECTTGARLRRTRRPAPQLTEISFVTENITPSQILNGDARYIGIVVWVPKDVYERPAGEVRDSEAA